MSDFDDSVREFYRGQVLSEERAQTILSRSVGRVRRRLRAYQLTGVVAVLAIGLFGLQHQFGSGSALDEVLAEVAMNHEKRLSVEVASDRYQVVQAGLDRLDFPILPARRGLLDNYGLLGGRYCSIRGELAAQLKVQDRISGNTITMYVTPLTDALEGVVARDEVIERDVDQVRIRLWGESGRFFALAANR